MIEPDDHAWAIAARGIEFKTKADEGTDGPASFVLEDPDGNLYMLHHRYAPRQAPA